MANEKDAVIKKFLEKPENFSDLFNGSLFRGKQVLKADMLGDLPCLLYTSPLDIKRL